MRLLRSGPFLMAALFCACGDDNGGGAGGGDDEDAGGGGGGGEDGGGGGDDDGGGGGGAACVDPDPSVTVPEGFCARVFADGVGVARHVTVSPSGDVFVAIGDSRDGTTKGHVLALRDEDGDGHAETQAVFGDAGGHGIAWRDGYLYFAENDRVIRWTMADGELEPTGAAEVIVSGLPADGDHALKSIVFLDDEQLLVNIGSASNACQVANRVPGSPGVDPCPELPLRAGVWRFEANRIGQTQADGVRLATGVRNATAITVDPRTGDVVAAINGRDQLHDNWPSLFTEEDDRTMPSEELVVLEDGTDRGWPYCFHDPAANQMKLAPEYGGDGETTGRCEPIAPPLLGMPAHWAPLGLVFSDDRLPEAYRDGVFVAFHGSRFEPNAPVGDEPGYSVDFVPFEEGAVTGERRRFATGFAGEGRPLPEAAAHRPVGLATAPDGALLVTDDWGGRVWRITATE